MGRAHRGRVGTLRQLAVVITSLCIVAAFSPAGHARSAATAELPPGCAPDRPAVVHRPGGRPVADQPPDRPIPCMTVTGNAIEAATAGVTSLGTVFFGSIDEVPTAGVRTIFKPSALARSTDQGATWEMVIPGDETATHGSLSPWMRIDPDTDRLWYATPTAPCGATISHSDDEGSTWFTNPNIGCPAQGGVALIEGPAPEGTPAPEGYPHIVYYCANSQDGDESFLACHRSRDGGKTFQLLDTTPDPIPPTDCEPTNIRRTRAGEVGPDGVLYFPTRSCEMDRIGLAVSDDQGESWTLSDAVEIEIQDLYPPAMAIDAVGDLFIAFKGPEGLPYLTVSEDRGETWSEPAMVGHPDVDEIRRVAIVARDDGELLLSYLGSRDGGDTFDAYMTTATGATAEELLLTSAAVNDPTTPVALAESFETYGDRIQLLRGHITADGTPWAAFHCFDTEACPGERLGLMAQLHPARAGGTAPGVTPSPTTSSPPEESGSLAATGGGIGASIAAILLGDR